MSLIDYSRREDLQSNYAAVKARLARVPTKIDPGVVLRKVHERSESEARKARYNMLRSLVILAFEGLGIPVTSDNYTGRKIQFVTAISFDIQLSKLIGWDQRQEICASRHLAMYVMHENFELSYAEIARLFGRSEATVRHGCKSFERLLEYGDAAKNTKPFHDLVTRISRECSTDMAVYADDLRVAKQQAEG